MTENNEETGLRCMVYSSSCIVAPFESDLLLILNQARQNNARNGITGLLSFDGQNFLQLLEGPAGIVREPVRRIREDSRHYDVQLILDEPITTRRFGDWGMGFAAVDPDSLAGIEGFRQRTEASNEAILNLIEEFSQNAQVS